MSPADLATLSLLEPVQGNCPDGHPCQVDQSMGSRRCDRGEYVGMPLICWDVTGSAIDFATGAGADARVVEWARSFLSGR